MANTGTPLKSLKATAPRWHIILKRRTTMAVCSVCGTKNNAAVGFCSMCGAKMASAVVTQAATPAATAVQTAPLPVAGNSGGPPAAYGQTYAVARNPVYANFFARFLALLIDEILLGLVIGVCYGLISAFLLFLALIGIGSGSVGIAGLGLLAEFGALALAVPMGIALTLWYFIHFETGPQQATFGKQMLGLKVVRSDGGRLNGQQSFGRFIVKHFLSGVFFMIGFIMAAFTHRKQALHDLAAGTIVIQAR